METPAQTVQMQQNIPGNKRVNFAPIIEVKKKKINWTIQVIIRYVNFNIPSQERYNSPEVLCSSDGDSEIDESCDFDQYESCDNENQSDTQQNHPSDDVFHDLSENSSAEGADLDESDFDDDNFYDDGDIPPDYTDSDDDAPSPDPSDNNQQQ